jgi:hypothetical protein|tara:strand:- start:702 stop:1571 length:870 start_codon:yes stop_codon:yes gene_type:complete
MRIRDFRFVNPGEKTISLIFNSTGSQHTVKQVNISTNDCDNRDLFDILLNVETLGFEIDGAVYTTDILSREQRPNYFHYEIEDFLVPSASIASIVLGPCIETTLTPGPDLIGFANSDGDVLISNATETRKSEHLFEVDRSGDSVIPGNYINIISSSAQFADVPDSNYSSQGILNSRYDGAETTISDFGVEPLISGKVFEGAEYLVTSSNAFICSQSLSDRTIEEYFFSIPTGSVEDSDTPIEDSKIFEFDKNRILPIKDRKIWVKDNRVIIETNEKGIVQSTIIQCTVE